MQKAPDPPGSPVLSTPRWSPDRMWWWDGVRWVLANPAPVAAPPIPPPPPPSYGYLPPPYYPPPFNPVAVAPSRGLRVLLIVMLGVAVLLSGLLSLAGTIAVIGGDTSAVSVSLWLLFLGIFILSVAGLVGVAIRSTWGRWVALAAGLAACVTCLGSVVGIPIIVAAARVRLGKPA